MQWSLLALAVLTFFVVTTVILNHRHFWMMVSHRLYQANKAYEAEELMQLGRENNRADPDGLRLRELIISLGPPERHGITLQEWQARVTTAQSEQLVRAVNDAFQFCQRVGLDRHPRAFVPRADVIDCAC